MLQLPSSACVSRAELLRVSMTEVSPACQATNEHSGDCALTATCARQQTPDLDDVDIVVDDISNLLEAMDVSADAEDEAATAWAASELDVEALKQAFAEIKGDDDADWKAAFGEKAEITDIVVDEDEDASGSGGDVGGFGEPITF